MSLNIAVPLVNGNGTSRKALAEQQINIIRAADALIAAMGEATPHGRDYILDPAVYQQAERKHRERREAVEAVRKAAFHIALALRN